MSSKETSTLPVNLFEKYFGMKYKNLKIKLCIRHGDFPVTT